MATTASQDPAINFGSRFAHLQKPIKDLAQNWEVDIAGDLEDYLLEVEQRLMNGSFGEMSINFAEAALIIQQSTAVYSKKVEYLYNLALNMLTSLKNKNSEAAKKTKCGKEDAILNEQMSRISIKSCKNIDLKAEQKSMKAKLVPKVPPALIPLGETEKRDAIIYSSKGENIGNKRDFRSNSSTLCSVGLLLVHSTSRMTAPAVQRTLENVAIGDAMDDDDDDRGPVDAGSDDHSDNEDSRNVLTEVAEKQHSHRKQKEPSIRPVRRSLRLRNHEEASQVNKAKALERHEEKTVNKPAKKDTCEKVKVSKAKRRTRSKRISEKVILPLSQFCSKAILASSTVLLNKPLKVDKFAELKSLFMDELAKQKPKKDTKNVNKKDRGNNEGSDNDDESDHLPGNGSASSSDDEEKLDNGDCGAGGDADKSKFEVMMSGAKLNKSKDGVQNGMEFGPSYEELLKMHVEKYLKNAAQYKKLTELTKAVSDWEDRIKPVLKQEELRKPFDIRVYGSSILEQFVQPSQTLRFTELVKDKDHREACRYFLASLQLANHYNVHIRAKEPLNERINTMELQLLSRKRHHEELDLQ